VSSVFKVTISRHGEAGKAVVLSHRPFNCIQPKCGPQCGPGWNSLTEDEPRDDYSLAVLASRRPILC
jgi:hypothetical protein